MNLETIRKISFKEKKILVAEACLMFTKLSGVKNIIESKMETMKLSDSIIMKKKQSMKQISIFETILSLLDSKQSMIIQNDFIDKLEPN